jgi:integrase
MASIRKKGKGGNYYARFYDSSRTPSRKEIPLRTTRKTVARKRLVELEEAFERGEYDPWAPEEVAEPHSLSEAIQAFLVEKKESVRESTVQGYKSKLEHFERDYTPPGLMLQDVGEEHVRGYVNATKRSPKKGPIKESTKAMRYRHARAFFNWCVDTGRLEASPVDSVNKPKVGKKQAPFLKPEDVDTLLRTIDAHAELRRGEPGPQPHDEWLKDMIVVGVGTGLRRAELLNLRWADIDLDDGMLYVRNRNSFTTKSGHERPVPLRGDALERLRQMRDRAGSTSDTPVFLDSRDLPPKPDRVSKRFKFYVRKAKLPERERLSFHNLRHTTGSWLAMQGVPMRIIQQILGHSTIQVTERYSHLSPEVLGKAMEETFGNQ